MGSSGKSGTSAPLASVDFTPSAVGQWYMSPLARAFRALAPTQGRLYLYPVFSGADGTTLDQFDVTTTIAGSAGAVARFGLWTVDNQAKPFAWVSGTQWATLLADLGTVATDGVAAQKILTPAAQVIPPLTWFAVGICHQVAAPATCNVVGQSGGSWWSKLGNATAAGAGGAPSVALIQNSVTGAFGNFTPSATSNVDGGAGFHRSA